MPQNLPFKIYFEDQHLIVLSKPAGLLSQGEETGSQNLVDILREYFGRHYVGLVHRLDRNTSGLMVVAKRTKAARRLTESLKKKDVKRKYVAIVQNTLEEEKHWQHYLLKDENKNKMKKSVEGFQGAKKSSLWARPLERGKAKNFEWTLVEFELETGRSHQIRVQSAIEGFPLVGDRKYGRDTMGEEATSRTALHAYKIEFPHPMSGEILEFQDELPADLKKVIGEVSF